MKVLEILHIIFDKRLYGRKMFYFSLPILGIAFIINSIILYFFNYWLLMPYAIIFLLYILVCALPAKNIGGRDFHVMEPFLSSLFLLTSVFGVFATIAFSNGLLGYTFSSLEYFLFFMISQIALLISVLHVTVYGQRFSLRESAGLTDDFFDKQRKVWSDELKEIPSANKIVTCLEDGKFIPHLFDKGLFNLTVLWSCNVMEKIIDAATDEIIARKPEKRSLFFKNDGRRIPYSDRLKNLGFEYSAEERLFDIDILWDKIRNKIAHHNYKPTFDETYETLKVLVSFTHKMPSILKTWLA